MNDQIRPSELPGVEHRHVDLRTGVRAHVAVSGSSHAPRVLALHGWPQHWWTWRHVIGALGSRVQIACPDLRGFGWSGDPADGDWRKERLADDALATLDALGWDDAVVVGHDWGGIAAYLMALRAPDRVRGLVTLSIPHPWQPVRTLLKSAHRFAYQVPVALPVLGATLIRQGRFVSAILDAAAGPDHTVEAGDRRTYLDALGGRGSGVASERLYRSFLLQELPRIRGRVDGQRLAMPVRSLIGTHDPLGAHLALGLEQHGDDATVELVDRAGHWLPEQHPELVARRIVDLTALRPASPRSSHG